MTRASEHEIHNLLIVSDLHLGEDLRPGGAGVSYLRHLVRLERELEKFLRHHVAQRLNGRPWRLVVNGDMVDFMSMKVMPESHSTVDAASAEAGEGFEDDDGRYGLGFGERAAMKKLDRVLERHRSVFHALGDFVRAGNELVVVVGNHDVEFHYAGVQRTFVEWLAGLPSGEACRRDAGGDNDEARASFMARITFCPWFYYEENRIYVEHGHQFDEYCSFDYQLHPAPMAVAPVASSDTASPLGRRASQPRRSKSRFALSMAHAGMRYFANQLPEYDPHTAESWGVVSYFRWAAALGWTGLARISFLYGLLVWKVVEAWYWMRGADGERRAVHLVRMKALGRTWKLTEDKLLGLLALHRVPVTRRFFGVLRALFLDRVLVSGIGVGAALAFATGLTGPLRWLVPAGIAAAVLVANDVLGRSRLESSAARLRAVPRMVQKLVGAPLIVFGHSHAPERVVLPNGALYFNTGTWASEDARVAFTHLVVDTDHAELRQWRDGESAPFELLDENLTVA